MFLDSAGSFLVECLLHPTRRINEDRILGKQNYSFQKRQKELAKKKKKEEKKQRKLESQDTHAGEDENLLQED